jgi:hypothetical protein
MSFENKITLGADGLLQDTYRLEDVHIEDISRTISRKVNGVLGYNVLSGVGSKLITDIFDTVRRQSTRIHVDDVGSILDMLKRQTVSIITTDAIAHYDKKKKIEPRSIWTRVDRVHSRNVNGDGMINRKGVSGSPIDHNTFNKGPSAGLEDEDPIVESFSVWSSVDRVHSQNVNGNKMITANGVRGSYVPLRF